MEQDKEMKKIILDKFLRSDSNEILIKIIQITQISLGSKSPILNYPYAHNPEANYRYANRQAMIYKND